MNKLLKIGIILSCMVSSSFAVEVGKTLPHVILEGKNGGLSNNRVWNSKQLKGKIKGMGNKKVVPDKNPTPRDIYW